jgi:hypothetical protein
MCEVLAHEREVVLAVDAADRPDPLDAVEIPHLAAERVAGVGRVGDHPAAPDDVSHLRDRPALRVVRVNVEVPRHVTSVGS